MTNGLKIQWGFYAGSISGGKANVSLPATYTSRDSFVILLQDADGNNPRQNNTQKDTEGYGYVTGVDQQYASSFCVSISATLRTFYWLTIGF